MMNGRVAIVDKVENYTEMKLPNGQYAYSSEFDPETNTAVPLAYKTNSFCAGGMTLADGRVLVVGGNGPLDFIDPTVGDGFKSIRYLTRSMTDASLNGKDWAEPGNKLTSERWYPSVQILPDGRQFVCSGSLNGLDPGKPENNNPTYEILDANGISSGQKINMDILVANQPYYMYPFIHLMRDGNLFVFTSKSSEIFNPNTGATVKKFADLAGDYRTYPNTGGSVMLPLSKANNYEPDIMVCGGGAYQDITSPTDASCGRMKPLGAATWEMDSMPQGRGMVEGNLLLDGTVLWLNGANRGAQGFQTATDATLDALIYDPSRPLGDRWRVDATSQIARVYHSTSTMLLDGTVLVTGSNPVEMPILQPTADIPYVTEFRTEKYTPPYLMGDKKAKRPGTVTIGNGKTVTCGGDAFQVQFKPAVQYQDVKVVLYYAGFVTHSVHMGMRMVYLDYTGTATGTTNTVTLNVSPPPNTIITPPGPYMLFVVGDGVPSVGQFVMVK